MDLSSSQNKNNADKDFMDLNNQPPQEDDQQDVVVGGGGDKTDEILPSYDFQPIRPIVSSQPSNFESSSSGGARVWASAESKTNFGTRVSRLSQFRFFLLFPLLSCLNFVVSEVLFQ